MIAPPVLHRFATPAAPRIETEGQANAAGAPVTLAEPDAPATPAEPAARRAVAADSSLSGRTVRSTSE